METFSALLAICAGNSPVPGEFPAQRPATRSWVNNREAGDLRRYRAHYDVTVMGKIDEYLSFMIKEFNCVLIDITVVDVMAKYMLPVEVNHKSVHECTMSN